VKTDFPLSKPNFIPAISSRLSILFINNILRDLDKAKIHLYKLFVRFLVDKPACENAEKILPQPKNPGGGGGRGRAWIFIHGTNIIDRGLKVIFLMPPPREEF